MTTVETVRTKPLSIPRPPLPREHGAWIILFAPMVIGFSVTRAVAPLLWLLLTLTITGAFLAREAASLLLRKRGKPGVRGWLAVYLLAMACGGLSLLVLTRSIALPGIGLLTGALFGLHSCLMLRQRQDRSQWGEILGVAALTLTAPAAFAATQRALDTTAWLLWIGCVGYFSSGIFYVKMWLAAAKAKAIWNDSVRRQIGRDNLLYHLLLTLAVVACSLFLPWRAGLALVVAYFPVLYRGLTGWAALSPSLPPLKRLGMLETLRALWFALFFVLVFRALS